MSLDGYREQMEQLRLGRVLGGTEPDPPPPPIPSQHCTGCGAEIVMRSTARGPSAVDPQAMPVRRIATGETRWYCGMTCYESRTS